MYKNRNIKKRECVNIMQIHKYYEEECIQHFLPETLTEDEHDIVVYYFLFLTRVFDNLMMFLSDIFIN